MPPLFSVLLTTYNRQQFLARAIRSVLQQRFKNFELIIIDDHSSDDTPYVVAEFSDNRITYIRQDQNQGVSVARNTGIKHAKGEYLCFLDDDDEYLPEFLQAIADFLKKRNQPFVGLIWTGIAHVYTVNNIANEKKRIKTERLDLNNNKNLSFLLHLLFSGITIHRTCFECVGVFNPTLKLREDTDLVYRLLAAGLAYASIPEVLIKIYIHEQVSLSRSIKLTDRIANTEYFLVAHAKFLNQHVTLWLRWHTNLVSDYYRSGKKQQARQLVFKIIKKCWYYTRIWELFIRLEIKSLTFKALKT